MATTVVRFSALAAAGLLVAAVAHAGSPAKQGAGLAKSEPCLACHEQGTPGIVAQWKDSGHARAGVGCFDCHQASEGDADAFDHQGVLVATVVTPRDCGRCHKQEDAEFEGSHHAKAGNILASLDNYLAETVEGARTPFDPHSATPGKDMPAKVNGLASVQLGCQQCHGGKVALVAKDGGTITPDDLKPGPDGTPTNAAAVSRIATDSAGWPRLAAGAWPNTGIGRLNLDGSLGSCAACHSRHDFSARRARQPENCGKCHLGPDHPQKEVYEESKHGVAYRDLRDKMNLGGKTWVLGRDYAQAPTCATCHLSANANGGKVTHDPGERISWTNRPAISLVMDTDASHKVVTEADPARRKALVADTASAKRGRMKEVCTTCHAPNYIEAFYQQYDDLVVLYNEKFAKPGSAIMAELARQGLVSKAQFDDSIEWDWYYLLLSLAPRGAARSARRLDDGARLHALARHVRGGRALLREADP